MFMGRIMYNVYMNCYIVYLNTISSTIKCVEVTELQIENKVN